MDIQIKNDILLVFTEVTMNIHYIKSKNIKGYVDLNIELFVTKGRVTIFK